MRNSEVGCLTRSNTNRSVQSQKQATSLKFLIKVEERFYYQSSESKGVISCAVTAQLICVFVCAYSDCWFSGAAAQV